MTRIRAFLLACGLLAATGLSAAPVGGPARDFGLGLILGAPSGLTGKLWLDGSQAVDIAVGNFGYYVGSPYNSSLNVHVDYLWHYFGVFGGPGSAAYRQLPVYVGVGGMFSSPDVAGARVVLGITYLFNAPFDLFFEVAPTLVVAPIVGMGTDAGLGGRFYF
jgi:hypothetical protein